MASIGMGGRAHALRVAGMVLGATLTSLGCVGHDDGGPVAAVVHALTEDDMALARASVDDEPIGEVAGTLPGEMSVGPAGSR